MNTNRPYTYNYNPAANTGYAAPQVNGYPAPQAQHYAAPQAPRYAAPKTKVKVPGRAGAIARLIVMALMILLGMCVVIGSAFSNEMSFGELITGVTWGTGTMLLLGAWIWIVMKWIGYIAPKSLQWAKSFWCAWHPLTFFGLYIKAMIFLVILIAPSSASMVTYSPLLMFAFKSVENMNFLVAFATFMLGMAIVSVLISLDVCKLKGWSVKGTAKVLFDKAKLAFAGRKQ